MKLGAVSEVTWYGVLIDNFAVFSVEINSLLFLFSLYFLLEFYKFLLFLNFLLPISVP